MKYSIIIFIICFFSLDMNAIDSSAVIQTYEDSLSIYFKKMASERSDIVKEKLNERILEYFWFALESEESFDYNFGSLKHVGIITSPDENLRIITWNLPYNDHTHRYYGFIQYKKSRNKTLLFELNDQSDFMEKPEYRVLSHQNWFGALYYRIIENKYRGTVYYTLLGADLNDLFTKKKIIEVLYFNSEDQPVFGKQVFKNKLEQVNRVIFEYSAQADMALNYDREKEMIVFDHLSPSKPSLTGQLEFYGPDFSYDGLKFERGIWNLYPDIDVRNYNIE